MSWSSILQWGSFTKRKKRQFMQWEDYKQSRFNNHPKEIQLKDYDKHSEEE